MDMELNYSQCSNEGISIAEVPRRSLATRHEHFPAAATVSLQRSLSALKSKEVPF